METYIKIGKAVLKELSEYNKKDSMDDENEYFPIIKVIIAGIVNSYNGPRSDKDRIGNELLDFIKQLYINMWLEYANEEEDEPDIEQETKNAIETFNERYFNK